MIFDRLNELKEIVDTEGNYDDYYKRLSSDEYTTEECTKARDALLRLSDHQKFSSQRQTLLKNLNNYITELTSAANPDNKDYDFEALRTKHADQLRSTTPDGYATQVDGCLELIEHIKSLKQGGSGSEQLQKKIAELENQLSV